MSYKTIWENNGVYQRYSGLLANKDRVLPRNEVMGDERFDKIKYWIVGSLLIEEYLLDRNDAVEAAAFAVGASSYKKNLRLYLLLLIVIISLIYFTT